MNLFSIYISLVLFILALGFVGGAFNEDDLTSDYELESPKSYKTVRLIFKFGSGSCVSSFGSSPKVETAAVSSFGLTQKWKLRTRFQF